MRGETRSVQLDALRSDRSLCIRTRARSQRHRCSANALHTSTHISTQQQHKRRTREMKLDHDASAATTAQGKNGVSARASDHPPKPPLPPPSLPPPLPAPHHLYGSSCSAKSPRFAARKHKQLVHSTNVPVAAATLSNSSGGLYSSQSDASRANRHALSALQHRVCHQFAARGVCDFGARCRYSHDVGPPPVPLNIRFVSSLSLFDACLDVHKERRSIH